MKRLERILPSIVLWLMAALAVAPLGWAIAESLRAGPPIGLAYAKALATAPLLRYAANSLLVAGLIALGQTLTGGMAAYAFARLHFRGRDALFLIFLATLLLPPQATILPSFLLMVALGLISSYSALVLPSLFHPFAMFFIRQSLLDLPVELEDAARIDGCTSLSMAWHIALPFAAPALLASGLFSFLWSWHSFMWPLVVSQSETYYTLPVGLAMLASGLVTDWPVLMAGATIATLPAVTLFLLAQRPFSQASEVSWIVH